MHLENILEHRRRLDSDIANALLTHTGPASR